MSFSRFARITALASLLACAVGARAADLAGVVRGPDGTPVPGALVAAVAGGSSTVPPTQRTDAAGAFRFTGLAAGRYGVTASAPGFEGAFRGEVEAKDGAASPEVELSLSPSRWVLAGRATDPRGASVPGARVFASRISKDKGDLWVAEPGPDGRFSVALPEARYVVSIRADGFEKETRIVASGESRPLDVRLTSVAEATSPAPAAVVAALRAAAIPLAGVEAGHGFRDLERVKRAVGDARVVALGEATHGSREFFQLKHRLLELLVSEMGFTVFAIEANWPEALAVDDYVRTGRGDPAKALAGLYFWTWNTEEVLDLIRWMRRWNEDEAHTRKLRFAGIDMQFPGVAARAVRGFLTAHGGWSPAWDEGMGLLTRPDLRVTWPTLKEEERSAVSKALSDVVAKLEGRRPPGTAAPGRDEWELARQHARILEQFEQMLRGDPFDVRDRSMAENAAWVLEHAGPGARMVLWAHNGHVSRSADVGVGRPMGAGLAARFGKGYLSFGFAFDSGSFRAVPPKGALRTFTVAPAPAGTADAALAATGLPLFALDLRGLPEGSSAGDWMRAPQKTRSIGAVYDESSPERYFLREVLPDHYDALLFVAKTTAARSNPTAEPDVKLPPPAPVARNLTFEEGPAGGEPAGWTAAHPAAEDGWSATVTGENPAEGEYAAVLTRKGEAAPGTFGSLVQRVDASPWRGRKIRLRASLRAADGSPARLFLRVDRPGDAMGFFDNMYARPVRGPAWTVAEISGEVDPDAVAIAFGLWLEGTGRVFVDDVSLSEVPDK